MKYMLLIYEDQAPYATATQAEQGALFQSYMDFTADIRREGKMVTGDALQPSFTATTIRIKDGKRIATDGPFAESKEQLGGFYIVDVKDIEEATAIAERICRLHSWNQVVLEVRPVMVFDA
jgi:hypothetical protein